MNAYLFFILILSLNTYFTFRIAYSLGFKKGRSLRLVRLNPLQFIYISKRNTAHVGPNKSGDRRINEDEQSLDSRS